MSAKRLLLVRTFKLLKGGGPVPPLGILYLAAVIRECFGACIDVKIMDLGRVSINEATDEFRRYQPDYVGLSTMSCEADLMNNFAKLVKEHNSVIKVIAGGPHTTVAKERILDNENIDCVAIGEAEKTIVELLEALENSGDLTGVDGIAFRNGNDKVITQTRSLVEDLDALPFPAWDLIDFKGYADYSNWNGVLKEDCYAVISTSRGCPYRCYFCHNIFGKKVRFRSPESIFGEMSRLREEYGVKEVHILDDVFNINVGRAKRICELIIEDGSRFSLAFPNGLRADIMTKELVSLLKKAGTYKIHYGFETVSPRLQKMIGKNLDIPKAVEMFDATAGSGIITGAYFMLGFPTQTREEIMETINFATESSLDVAYFFKATPYPGTGFFSSVAEDTEKNLPDNFSDYHFYSTSRSYGEIDETELNELILLAQQKFFLKASRLLKSFLKSPRKRKYVSNLVNMIAVLIQSYLFKSLMKTAPGSKS